MTDKRIDDFDASNEVPSNWVKFNIPLEDKVMGTLISIREVKNSMPGKEEEMVKIYEIKTDYGSFHELDEKKKLIEAPVLVSAGEIWNIGGRAIIDKQMRNVKIGQKVGMKYIEEVAAQTKGYNPAKIIKVFTPHTKNADGSFAYTMDTEWLNSIATPTVPDDDWK